MENPIKMDDFGVPAIQIAPTSKVQDFCIFGELQTAGTPIFLVRHEVCASVPGCDVQKRARTLDRAEAAFAQHRNRMQVAGSVPGGAGPREGNGTNWGEKNWGKVVEIC